MSFKEELVNICQQFRGKPLRAGTSRANSGGFELLVQHIPSTASLYGAQCRTWEFSHSMTGNPCPHYCSVVIEAKPAQFSSASNELHGLFILAKEEGKVFIFPGLPTGKERHARHSWECAEPCRASVLLTFSAWMQKSSLSPQPSPETLLCSSWSQMWMQCVH